MRGAQGVQADETTARGWQAAKGVVSYREGRVELELAGDRHLGRAEPAPLSARFLVDEPSRQLREVAGRVRSREDLGERRQGEPAWLGLLVGSIPKVCEGIGGSCVLAQGVGHGVWLSCRPSVATRKRHLPGAHLSG